MSQKQRAKKTVLDYYRRFDSTPENIVEDLLFEVMHPEIFGEGMILLMNNLVPRQCQTNSGDR